MWEYFVRYHGRLGDILVRHLAILGASIVISVFFAALITLFLEYAVRLRGTVLRIFGVIYSIPSLALFAILIPILGLGFWTAVFVLSLYNQFLLIRNFLTGLKAVDSAIIHAGTGMGMTNTQLLFKIKAPLAFPAIMAGIRLAVISTIGIGTISAVINAGGIGSILFDGLRTMNSVKIIWGTILAAGLAIAANAVLSILERKIYKKIFLGK
ncbi:MAG: ABC transporter permease [Spirochaetaceae bacterium]|jgi:osmoprotectant transport system permease protein|nr:ABC transporter permease [Spirochaetaceae bacterium]